MNDWKKLETQLILIEIKHTLRAIEHFLMIFSIVIFVALVALAKSYDLLSMRP